MNATKYLEEINACHTLFLSAVDETSPNALRLVLREGRLAKTPVTVDVAGQSLGEAYRVEIDDSCATFELKWDVYVRYQITNESFGLQLPENRGKGHAACHQESDFLEYLSRSSIASNEYPGTLYHFQFLCSDHIVDIVSTSHPHVEKIGPAARIH